VRKTIIIKKKEEIKEILFKRDSLTHEANCQKSCCFAKNYEKVLRDKKRKEKNEPFYGQMNEQVQTIFS